MIDTSSSKNIKPITKQIKSNIKKNTQFEMLKKLQLKPKDFLAIAKFCKKLNI